MEYGEFMAFMLAFASSGVYGLPQSLGHRKIQKDEKTRQEQKGIASATPDFEGLKELMTLQGFVHKYDTFVGMAQDLIQRLEPVERAICEK